MESMMHEVPSKRFGVLESGQARRPATRRLPHQGRSAWLGLLLLGSSLVGACGARGPSGLVWCQDTGGAFHFRAMVPPLKYVQEWECVEQSGSDCISWKPTGRKAWVVADVPFVNWDTELVSILYVSPEDGQASALVQAKVQDILESEDATLLTPDTPTEQGETNSGLPWYGIFWRERRTTKEQTSYDWRRWDVFVQGSARVFHLEFLSIYSLDREDFRALLESFAEGPAPDGGRNCPCLDEHTGEAKPCE